MGCIGAAIGDADDDGGGCDGGILENESGAGQEEGRSRKYRTLFDRHKPMTESSGVELDPAREPRVHPNAILKCT